MYSYLMTRGLSSSPLRHEPELAVELDLEPDRSLALAGDGVVGGGVLADARGSRPRWPCPAAGRPRRLPSRFCRCPRMCCLEHRRGTAGRTGRCRRSRGGAGRAGCRWRSRRSGGCSGSRPARPRGPSARPGSCPSRGRGSARSAGSRRRRRRGSGPASAWMSGSGCSAASQLAGRGVEDLVVLEQRRGGRVDRAVRAPRRSGRHRGWGTRSSRRRGRRGSRAARWGRRGRCPGPGRCSRRAWRPARRRPQVCIVSTRPLPPAQGSWIASALVGQ